MHVRMLGVASLRSSLNSMEWTRAWARPRTVCSGARRVRVRACAAFVMSIFAQMSTGVASAQPCSSYWYPAEVPASLTIEHVLAMTLWDPDGDGPREKVVVLGGNIFPGRVAAYDPQQHTWMTFGAGVPNWATGLAVLPTGELVAACQSPPNGGVFKWNGTAWVPLANTELNSAVAVKVSPAGELYAAGQLRSGTTFVEGVARWNGSTWERLGPVEAQTVQDFTFFPDGRIAAARKLGSAGTSVAIWNGSVWTSLVGPGLSSAASVRDLVVASSDRLLLCGVSIGSFDPVIEWTGSSWSSYGNSQAEIYNWASSVLPLADGRVVVAGELIARNRPALGSIAMWDGSAWRSLQLGLQYGRKALLQMPNGDLAVGGRTVPRQSSEAYGPLWFFHFGDQPDHVLQPPFASATLGLGVDNEIALPASGAGPFTFQWLREAITSGVTNWPLITTTSVPLTCSTSSVAATVAIDHFPTFSNLTVRLPIDARYRLPGCRMLRVRGVVTGACGEAVSPLITLNFCPSDFNADRHTDVVDLVDYLGVWFDQFGTTVATTVPAPNNANFDPDPRVAASDLFAFLDQWTAPDPACVP